MFLFVCMLIWDAPQHLLWDGIWCRPSACSYLLVCPCSLIIVSVNSMIVVKTFKINLLLIRFIWVLSKLLQFWMCVYNISYYKTFIIMNDNHGLSRSIHLNVYQSFNSHSSSYYGAVHFNCFGTTYGGGNWEDAVSISLGSLKLTS